MFKYNAELVRVIDGDTIVAMVDLGFSTWKKVTIRLYGLNAPESRTRDLEEKKKGLETKEYLCKLLQENNDEFILQSHGVGKFGRCLGEIFIEDNNINQQLINEGYATPYFGEKR